MLVTMLLFGLEHAARADTNIIPTHCSKAAALSGAVAEHPVELKSGSDQVPGDRHTLAKLHAACCGQLCVSSFLAALSLQQNWRSMSQGVVPTAGTSWEGAPAPCPMRPPKAMTATS
jgi:hypothetical protein